MMNNATDAASGHLDLGCGPQPRKPYHRQELYGIDIRAGLNADGVGDIVAANLSLAPILFPDNHLKMQFFMKSAFISH